MEYVRDREEHSDCAVCAYATAWNVSYAAAHSLFAHLGREPINWWPTAGTLEKWVARHPEGTYLLKTKGHVSVLIDGLLHDIIPPKPRARPNTHFHIGMNMNIPTNAVYWKTDCLAAIAYAHDSGGKLLFAAQFLVRQGWDHGGPKFLHFFNRHLSYVAADGNTVCCENNVCFFGHPQTWLAAQQAAYCHANALQLCPYCGAYNPLSEKTCINCGETL